MRAKHFGRSHVTARRGCSRTGHLSASIFLGILALSGAISLPAQSAATSTPEPSRTTVSATGGQAQDENQGDQSLDPDPLANPVNPPPTPEEPAGGDSVSAGTASPGPKSRVPAPAPAGAHSADTTPGGTSNRPAVAAFHPPPVPPPIPSADPRRQQINNECADLLQMANALKIAVDKTTQDELSVTVVREAGQIERAARKVKDEMRATMSASR
jgi:hypothetical protein